MRKLILLVFLPIFWWSNTSFAINNLHDLKLKYEKQINACNFLLQKPSKDISLAETLELVKETESFQNLSQPDQKEFLELITEIYNMKLSVENQIEDAIELIDQFVTKRSAAEDKRRIQVRAEMLNNRPRQMDPQKSLKSRIQFYEKMKEKGRGFVSQLIDWITLKKVDQSINLIGYFSTEDLIKAYGHYLDIYIDEVNKMKAKRTSMIKNDFFWDVSSELADRAIDEPDLVAAGMATIYAANPSYMVRIKRADDQNEIEYYESNGVRFISRLIYANAPTHVVQPHVELFVAAASKHLDKENDEKFQFKFQIHQLIAEALQWGNLGVLQAIDSLKIPGFDLRTMTISGSARFNQYEGKGILDLAQQIYQYWTNDLAKENAKPESEQDKASVEVDLQYASRFRAIVEAFQD